MSRHLFQDRRPLVSLLCLGLVWSVLSALLWREGAAARAVLLPIAPEAYYGAQALFVGPWLAVLGTLFAVVASGVARLLGGDGDRRATWRALVPIWATALLVLFALPDLVVVLALGREHLPRAMRYYAPLAPITIAVLSTRRVVALHHVATWRAAVSVMVALVVQAVVGALLLR